MSDIEIKTKRESKIIFLRRSKAIILTDELDDFKTYNNVVVEKLKDKSIRIYQEDDQE